MHITPDTASTPLPVKTTQNSPSVRLHVRGLQIDTQCGKGGVVNLIVRTDQEHKSIWGRLCQHIADALFRAGDACYPGNNNGALQVMLRQEAGAAVNDALPQRTDSDIFQVWPLYTANGDAYYIALLVHEGVKRHQNGRAAPRNAQDLWGQKSASNLHNYAPLIDTWALCGLALTTIAGFAGFLYQTYF